MSARQVLTAEQQICRVTGQIMRDFASKTVKVCKQSCVAGAKCLQIASRRTCWLCRIGLGGIKGYQ